MFVRVKERRLIYFLKQMSVKCTLKHVKLFSFVGAKLIKSNLQTAYTWMRRRVTRRLTQKRIQMHRNFYLKLVH